MSWTIPEVELPRDLIEAIDARVGMQGRSGFLVRTARAELSRQRVVPAGGASGMVLDGAGVEEALACCAAGIKVAAGAFRHF